MNLSRADIRRIGHATAAAILAASDSQAFERIVMAVARALQAEAPPPAPAARRHGVLATMPEEKLALLRARFEAGENVAALERELGIPKTTIFSHAERHGWVRPPPAPKMTLEQKKALKAAQNARYRQSRKARPAAQAAPAPTAAHAPEAPQAEVQNRTSEAHSAPAPAMPANPAIRQPAAPRAAQPTEAPAPVTTTPKEVRQWLAQAMYVGGLTRRDAEDRVALLTHEQALDEANRRRVLVGYAPFRLLFVRSAR